MRLTKLLYILPVLMVLSLAAGCDNEGSNSANAQDVPGAVMSGSDATGTVQAESQQGCPNLIDGIIASDTLIFEMDATGSSTGSAKITNSTAGTSADCSGDIDASPPAAVSGCKVTSSTIPGIKVNDELEVSVAFSEQSRGMELANISSPDGITCAILTLETLNVM